MTSNHDRVRQYLSEHPGVSVRVAARDLGVSYSTVSRVRATPATPKDATPATLPDIPEPWALAGINVDMLRQLQERASACALADGFYQIENGKPYRINGGMLTDFSAMEFGTEGEAVIRASGVKYTVTRQETRRRLARSVQQRAE